MGLYMYELMTNQGWNVDITRKDDIDLPPGERTEIVRNSGADICLSLHINAFNGEAKGAETIHSIHSDGKLATKILDRIVKSGMDRRRVFSRESERNPGQDYYFMHRETGSVQTVIIEYGFIDNWEDRQKLKNSDNRKMLVKATIEGLKNYLEN